MWRFIFLIYRLFSSFFQAPILFVPATGRQLSLRRSNPFSVSDISPLSFYPIWRQTQPKTKTPQGTAANQHKSNWTFLCQRAKDSKVFGSFPGRLDSRNISGCLETSLEISGCLETFPGSLKTFQFIKKLARMSGNCGRLLTSNILVYVKIWKANVQQKCV